MSRVELLISHYQENRFLKLKRFRAEKGGVVIGSASSSDIRIMGNDISPLHAMIEYGENGWELFDLASSSGIKLNNEKIVETLVTKKTEFFLGSHRLVIEPVIIENSLFVKEKNFKAEGSAFHQVVVKKFGQVMNTYSLPKNSSFSFGDSEAKVVLPPPKDTNWQIDSFGDYTVHRRKVFTKAATVDIEKPSFNKNDKIALLVGVFSFLFVAIGVFYISNNKEVPNALEEKEYRQVVFKTNLKKLKKLKKKKQLKKANKKFVEKPKVKKESKVASVSTSKAKSKNSKGSPRRIVKSLKSAGLSKIIGRISKRATTTLTKNVKMGNRVSSGSKRGIAIASATKGKFNGGASGNGKGKYRVGTIGTSGSGGGKGGKIGGIGSLSSGGVGSSDVGVVEDETVISGGLDRDVIARYIKSKLGQIKYCYERQLSAKPDLYGKIQVKFTIAGTGGVSAKSIAQTSMKNALVEGCILRRISKWKFPIPIRRKQ